MKRQFDEVTVPFRQIIEAGNSTFTVDIPRSFYSVNDKPRDFYFPQLELMPAYYSDEAQVMN